MAPLDTSVKMADGRLGPHPSYIEVAKPYIFESKIHERLTANGFEESRDDKVRLEGIAWIDSVRKALHLPIRTYNTAAVYYHKFRLVHPDNIGHLDAAAAALFTACKIEDTLKKSKEILCAAWNLKASPSERRTTDDPTFEQHSRTITGLERLMLEASGFDFRNRYPQRLVLKLSRPYNTSATPIARTAYNISLDLYRTFAPLKQTSPTMALACVELACRLHDLPTLPPELLDPGPSGPYPRFRISRAEVLETLFDLLSLYSDNKAGTLVGATCSIDRFLNIRIALNNEVSTVAPVSPPRQPRKDVESNKRKANGIPAQPNGAKKQHRTPRSPMELLTLNPRAEKEREKEKDKEKPGLKEGTVRFMLSEERAREEKKWVEEYFRMIEEEYEVEVAVEGGGGSGRRK